MINKLALKISKCSTCIFLTILAIMNIFLTYHKHNNTGIIGNQFDLYSIISILILGLIFYILYKSKLSNKSLFTIFIIIVFAFGMYWIISNDYNIAYYDDTYNCYEAAKSLLEHDYSKIGYKSYINMYPHNLPLVTLLMILYKIFGEFSLYFFRFLNLTLVIVAYIYIVKISNVLFDNSKINRITIILLYGFTQFVFMSYIPYGFIISYSCSIFSIYYYIKFLYTDSMKNLVTSLTIISLATVIKNNTLIIIVAMIIFALIKLINVKSMKIVIPFIISFLSISCLVNGITGFWAHKAMTTYDNKLPTIAWIALGLNQYNDNPGGYYDLLYYYHINHDFVAEYTVIEAKRHIKESIKLWNNNPVNALKFYVNKFSNGFNEPSFNSVKYYYVNPHVDINHDIYQGYIGDILFKKWDASMSILSIGLLIFVVRVIKKLSLNDTFIGVIAFGGFVFHMIWEINSIYTYIYIIMLIPYAAKGLYWLIDHYKQVQEDLSKN